MLNIVDDADRGILDQIVLGKTLKVLLSVSIKAALSNSFGMIKICIRKS